MNARSMMMLLAGAMAVALLAVGCGSSGGDSTTVTTSSLSKAAFIKKANGICERERNVIVKSTTPLPEAVELAYVPAYEGLVNDVRALGAPKGDEAEVEAFLDAMQEDIGSLQQRGASVKLFSETEEPFKDSAALAKKYGLSKCTFYARFTVN